jgi:hypothetical protein
MKHEGKKHVEKPDERWQNNMQRLRLIFNGRKGNEKWKQRRKVSRFPFVELTFIFRDVRTLRPGFNNIVSLNPHAFSTSFSIKRCAKTNRLVKH